MKLKYFSILFITAFILGSCAKHKPCSKSVASSDSTFKGQEISMAEFLYRTGDIIDTKQCPFLVHAQDILYNKQDFLLIDIRDSAEYVKGHIDGAYNVQRQNLLTFLNDSVNPAAYKKIAIIDDNGPLSEYIATLLRFDGYDNVYALKFGIATWNSKFVGNINKYLSNKYGNKLDNTPVEKPPHGQIPDISSDNILQLLDSRVAELIAEPTENIFISPDKIFANPDKYFTLAYWSEEKYSHAHIPGSVRYQTRYDLRYDRDLNTLPTDKKIVVYCNTGHHAIALVAYLRLLGYDASSFMYGANSFMNGKLREFAPGAAILDGKILCQDYPLLTGTERTSKKTASTTATANTPPPTPVVVPQKHTEGSVGGCE